MREPGGRRESFMFRKAIAVLILAGLGVSGPVLAGVPKLLVLEDFADYPT